MSLDIISAMKIASNKLHKSISNLPEICSVVSSDLNFLFLLPGVCTAVFRFFSPLSKHDFCISVISVRSSQIFPRRRRKTCHRRCLWVCALPCFCCVSVNATLNTFLLFFRGGVLRDVSLRANPFLRRIPPCLHHLR